MPYEPKDAKDEPPKDFAQRLAEQGERAWQAQLAEKDALTTYQHTACQAESDGFHLHEYRSGTATVTEHLHSWMDEHLERWPDSSRVYLKQSHGWEDEPYQGSVEQAWAEISREALPDVQCSVKAAS